MGATIYFDNLQSGEVTQLLNTMGHHTVGLKLHRKGDRSPEPGQTWTHEVFSSQSSEVVLVSAGPAHLCPKPRPPPPHRATLTYWPLPEPQVCLRDLPAVPSPASPPASLLSQTVCLYPCVACGCH